MAGEAVAEVFVRAEEAYFTNCEYDVLAPSGREVHETNLTDLIGTCPGPPTYLGDAWGGRKVMRVEGRARYAASLSAVIKDLPALAESCRDDGRIARIAKCIQSVLADIAFLTS
jgi:hypothetical protein